MVRQPRYTKDEHARLGNEIYEQQVRSHVESANHGRIVAIDVDSGSGRRHIKCVGALVGTEARRTDLVRSRGLSGRASLRPACRDGISVIVGTVNANIEAIIQLSVADAHGEWHDLEGVIDTGFSGFITLPGTVISVFAPPWICRQEAQLADGSLQTFDVYSAAVRWRAEVRTVEVEAADVQPLVGMGCLASGHARLVFRGMGHVHINACHEKSPTGSTFFRFWTSARRRTAHPRDIS